MANTFQVWKGAVAPAQSSPSNNQFRLWKGAVEPADDVAGGRIMSSLAGAGGLAGQGGIAGHGGGLAG